jgi:hypothetical protein
LIRIVAEKGSFTGEEIIAVGSISYQVEVGFAAARLGLAWSNVSIRSCSGT